jgi:hypothetical protein
MIRLSSKNFFIPPSSLHVFQKEKSAEIDQRDVRTSCGNVDPSWTRRVAAAEGAPAPAAEASLLVEGAPDR